MFKVHFFTDMQEAANYAYEVLTNGISKDSVNFSTYNLCLNCTTEECQIAENVDSESLINCLLDYFRDLDAREGLCALVQHEGRIVLDLNEEPGISDLYHGFPTPDAPDNAIFTRCGEGLTVITNSFAGHSSSHPIIAVKSDVYGKFGEKIFERLRPINYRNGEYTQCVAPAVYVEIV